MSKFYKVNDIFYTLQGEGFYTGVPAIFIRFAECNLRCDFCDTDFKESLEMTLGDLEMTLAQYPAKHVVLTGGEPSLQTDEELLQMLHAEGYYVQIETNGTNGIERGETWMVRRFSDFQARNSHSRNRQIPISRHIVCCSSKSSESPRVLFTNNSASAQSSGRGFAFSVPFCKRQELQLQISWRESCIGNTRKIKVQ